MARASGGARRRGGGSGRRDAAAGGGEAVRKGHWTAEEDAVLLEHVRVHGPRNWSSIRSKGFLPRTGKSCRLRWVNKLRPDLKTGCKFSAEEERVVLELQAQFGNKWARISTYLAGRTDNDVKNFWSTRQKRFARLLGTPLRGRSSRSRSARAQAPVASSLELRPATVVPCLDQVPLEGSSSDVHPCRAAIPFMDAQKVPLEGSSSGVHPCSAATPIQDPDTIHGRAECCTSPVRLGRLRACQFRRSTAAGLRHPRVLVVKRCRTATTAAVGPASVPSARLPRATGGGLEHGSWVRQCRRYGPSRLPGAAAGDATRSNDAPVLRHGVPARRRQVRASGRGARQLLRRPAAGHVRLP
ncbi:probable transcription factor MYB58 [Miscanthus floridulus]|uniref:probable transcription factor MYB58 n=1 Tax=Miscanthus floridulus TaxID=154761 RepID=UPI003459E679